MKRSKKMFTVMLALCVALSMAMASVTANAATKKPKKIYLKATSTTVDIKGKVKVSVYKTKPSKASKSVKWKSSNKKVATVSKSGYVTGKKKGTVKITATSKKRKKVKKTIKIKVTNLKAKSVTLNKKSASLLKGEKTQVKATVKGQTGFYNQGVTWKSSNTSVATVTSKGIVTAKKAGKATITATEKGGSKKATCSVTVQPDLVVDANAKTVTITATVNNATAKSMHYVVNKNGGAAKTSYFVTDVTAKEFSAALEQISATAWNDNAEFDAKTADVAQAGTKTINELAKAGVGNSNYTKMNVNIKAGTKTIDMENTLSGAKANDNFSMIYSNVANNHNAGSGCLTCNTSCYAGVVTNELKTWADPFVPKNMPKKGTIVSITYTSQDAENYTDIAGVKAALADDNSVVLDARKAADYEDAHIAGAVSADMDGYVGKSITEAASDANVKAVVDKYGASKKYVLICYSGNRYAKAARRVLMNNGVKSSNITILTGGMNAWRSAGEALDHYNYTNAATTFDKLKDSSYVILDARKAADYDNGHIAGAVSASVDGYIAEGGNKDEAAANVKAVVDKYGKDKKYIVICYSGNRYAKVATGLLMNNGIKNANIQTLGGDDSQQSAAGGMKAWNAKYEGYVVAKHTSSGNFNFANGITPENLKADVDGSKVFTVMDVRAAKDYNPETCIKGAVSTPSSDEAAVMKAVNDNKNGLYVLVCYTGNAKANEARNIMVKNGVDESRIICLQGGMKAWNN